MQSDWEKIERWYGECVQQIYPEPYCGGHVKGTKEVIKKFVCPRLDEIKTVLDIGCGEGVASKFFKKLGVLWVGVTLGVSDIRACQRKGLRAFEWDMHFIDLPDESADLVWARHIAEHSPMPYFFLKEAHRLARKYLLLVVPRTPFFCYNKDGPSHPNHPSASISREGWLYLAEMAGWELIDEDFLAYQIEERLWFRKKGADCL